MHPKITFGVNTRKQ